VFYVYDNGQHGLIVDTINLSSGTGIQWYNGTNRTTGAMNDGIGAGAINTAIIVSGQIADNQSGSFAALLCVQYSSTQNGVTYGNWYLPSHYELGLLNGARSAVFPYYMGVCWSSTETGSSTAKFVVFGSGQATNDFKSNTYGIFAVRAF
jgi:hypothetical protein